MNRPERPTLQARSMLHSAAAITPAFLAKVDAWADWTRYRDGDDDPVDVRVPVYSPEGQRLGTETFVNR